MKDDIVWNSTENYFQAQKNEDIKYRLFINGLSPFSAYEEGQKIALRKDWENVKAAIMYEANFLKFTQNTKLSKLLIETDDYDIVFNKSTAFWNEKNSLILRRLRVILKRLYS